MSRCIYKLSRYNITIGYYQNREDACKRAGFTSDALMDYINLGRRYKGWELKVYTARLLEFAYAEHWNPQRWLRFESVAEAVKFFGWGETSLRRFAKNGESVSGFIFLGGNHPPLEYIAPLPWEEEEEVEA